MKRNIHAIAIGIALACSAPALAEHHGAGHNSGSVGEYSALESANVAAVTGFYNAALNEKNAEKAASFLGEHYVQHNPAARDGAAGLTGFIGWLSATFPENISEIKRVFADGDFVTLHVHTRRSPEMRGNAIMEIFRLEDGKIVEHWDVIQEIPEESANSNTMF